MKQFTDALKYWVISTICAALVISLAYWLGGYSSLSDRQQAAALWGMCSGIAFVVSVIAITIE